MESIHLYQYSYNQTHSRCPRVGLLLERGGCWSEASPLPGWSCENLFSATKQLLSLSKPDQLYPSIAFGLSCLIPDSYTPFSLPLAALLLGTPDQILQQGKAAFEQGFTHAKVKVGHLSLADAIRVVQELLPHFTLRLDVNRQWETEETLSFFSHFPSDAFEFVEEPLPKGEDLSSFTHPFALDETLREHPDIIHTPLPMLRALVIKPTLTGSLATCLKWAQVAKRLSASVVISSAYESGVGTFHLAQLAKRLQAPKTAVGLDPYRTIHEDVLNRPLQIKEGRLYIPQTIDVDVTKIREITHESELVSCC